MNDPTLLVLAGPNGSGKSTLYTQEVEADFPTFVNADLIAKTLEIEDEVDRNIEAANRAEKLRLELLEKRTTFAMETVFSRTDYWLGFLRNARSKGYHVWVLFVCLESAELSISRVASRVRKGGHDVEADKIVKRRLGAIQTAVAAIQVAHQLWLFDNSVPNQQARLVARFLDGKEEFRSPNLPAWTAAFLA